MFCSQSQTQRPSCCSDSASAQLLIFLKMKATARAQPKRWRRKLIGPVETAILSLNKLGMGCIPQVAGRDAHAVGPRTRTTRQASQSFFLAPQPTFSVQTRLPQSHQGRTAIGRRWPVASPLAFKRRNRGVPHQFPAGC